MIKVGDIVTGTEPMQSLSVSKGNLYKVVEITPLRVRVQVLKHVREQYIGRTFYALHVRELVKITLKAA